RHRRASLDASGTQGRGRPELMCRKSDAAAGTGLSAAGAVGLARRAAALQARVTEPAFTMGAALFAGRTNVIVTAFAGAEAVAAVVGAAAVATRKLLRAGPAPARTAAGAVPLIQLDVGTAGVVM